jgi:hypothetical protein
MVVVVVSCSTPAEIDGCGGGVGKNRREMMADGDDVGVLQADDNGRSTGEWNVCVVSDSHEKKKRSMVVKLGCMSIKQEG